MGLNGFWRKISHFVDFAVHSAWLVFVAAHSIDMFLRGSILSSNHTKYKPDMSNLVTDTVVRTWSLCNISGKAQNSDSGVHRSRGSIGSLSSHTEMNFTHFW